MTFASQETSRDQGAPIGLLLFTYGDGDGDVYGYTDAETEVAFGGVTYLPVANDRDSIKASGTLDKATIDVSLPQDSDISRLFDVWPPSRVVTLAIYQAHVGNDDIKLAWSGRVLGSRITGNAAIFTCEPISTSMRRSGLRRKYGYGCPHALYGASCGANKSAATILVAMESVTGPLVELPVSWSGAIDTAKYIGGLAVWTTDEGRVETRQIVKINSSTQILVSGDASSIPVGSNVALSLGCSHQMGDCGGLHSNIHNFGGQPWIPFKNPIGIANNFY